jgi:hypothetical protein
VPPCGTSSTARPELWDLSREHEQFFPAEPAGSRTALQRNASIRLPRRQLCVKAVMEKLGIGRRRYASHFAPPTRGCRSRRSFREMQAPSCAGPRLSASGRSESAWVGWFRPFPAVPLSRERPVNTECSAGRCGRCVSLCIGFAAGVPLAFGLLPWAARAISLHLPFRTASISGRDECICARDRSVRIRSNTCCHR